jgi:hypothetical protein
MSYQEEISLGPFYKLVFQSLHSLYLFDTNGEIHKYKTRNNNNLHLPVANLSKFNEEAYTSCIKVFNHLPEYMKDLTDN